MSETALNYLTLWDLDRKQREVAANNILNEVLEGNANPLKVDVLLKKLEEMIKIIRANEEFKEAVQDEISLHGESVEMHGAISTIKEKPAYDYEACKDEEYDILNKTYEYIGKKLKLRKKQLEKREEIIDEKTGEITNIPAPRKAKTYHEIKLK
jgi:hypothetical protein